MKKAYSFVKSNIRQLLEIIILIISIIIPFVVDLQNLFREYLKDNSLSPDNLIYHITISRGGYIASVILLITALHVIWKINANYIMNSKRVYHKYWYEWYWFCAKILRIKKCDLVLVPIYLQFKLVIKGTFVEYPLNNEDYPILDNEPECIIAKHNIDEGLQEINLILEDTYVIEDDQIPMPKRKLFTIKISRNNGEDVGRHYSEKLIEATINQVRKLNKVPVMNVFASTNPLNTKNIAKRVFALGDRGNVEHLYVFQQEEDGKRLFNPKGHQIY